MPPNKADSPEATVDPLRAAFDQAKSQLEAEDSGNAAPSAAPVEPNAVPVKPANTDTPATGEPSGESPTDDVDSAPIVYADPASLQGTVFKVKVDGEEIEVGYDDLVKGYSRTADYTRKTSALAEQRKEMEPAVKFVERLEQDPYGTLRQLGEAYGYEVGTPASAPAAVPTPVPADDYSLGFSDPPVEGPVNPGTPSPEVAALQEEVRALKAAQAKIEQDRALSSAAGQAKALVEKYQLPGITPAEVVKHQARHRFPSVEAALKDLAFDSVVERSQERAVVSANAARSTAAAKVSPGGSVATESVPVPQPKIESVDDALATAISTLGMTNAQLDTLV